MIFIDPLNTEYTTPPAPVIYFLTGHFSICLNSTWKFPNFKEWVLQYQVDKGSGFGDWIYHTIITQQKQHYNFIEAHPEYGYAFRYKVRGKGQESTWSDITHAGQPKVIGLTTVIVGDNKSVVSNPGYFLGEVSD